ncbi:hypothetical protein OG455_04570 [Kitasatospora sp. NBC_01287]|uniref:hypothetical protein n=1 Tax=Kitasatospora sp. NBC_01287 TaxID=2903573 RepID=UPI002251C357|nr:hypothetical protein [Kitasatospora sp. NBC_01287]MCX4744800.1 hypothetical protein [Kitasatospora sp. NBC_01287]
MTAPQDPTVHLPPVLPSRPVDPETDSATLLDEEVWDTPAVTIELPPAPADSTAVTVELGAATEVPTAAEAFTATEVPTAAEAFTATEVLTPTVPLATEPLSTAELPADELPVAEDGLRRFGPGVPVAAVAVPPQLAARWHGDGGDSGDSGDNAPAPAERPARGRGSRWLLPVLILLAVLGFLAWQWWPDPLTVTGVSVHTGPAGPACDGTAQVVGTLATEGGAGTVSYRWRRSDGTVSAELTQEVPKGSHRTEVVLRWTFDGKGTMAATATLEVLSPGARSAATTFTYTCR